MSVSLRRATPEDNESLSRLASQTFRDGWAAIISLPIADAYVAEAFTPEKLSEEIADPTGYVVVAVDVAGSLVGYARLASTAKATPDFVTGPDPILLQRLYVAADYRGQGVADSLLAHCTQEALRRGGKTLWLEAEPRNERAWRYYLRRGFVDVGGTVYPLPGAVNDQIRVLQKDIVPILRLGSPNDAEALGSVASRIFADTFSDGNKPETMAKYLAESFHPAKLTAELADPANLFLLAVTPTAREEIIGYTKLCFAPDEELSCVTGPQPVAELERFYLLHEWHGTGVADTLMQQTFRAASEQGTRTLWLGVYEENPRARRFYSRWGFKDVGEHAFLFGDEEETDIVMMRVLDTIQ
jgi:ribosomal protein S18 acetylase RimI-like enzyme